MISDPRSIPRSNEPLIAFIGNLGFLLTDERLHVVLIGVGPGKHKRVSGNWNNTRRSSGGFA